MMVDRKDTTENRTSAYPRKMSFMVERPRSLSRLTDISNASDSEYWDASDTVVYSNSLELLDTIAETQITLNLFMNNKFDLAEERMAELSDKTMYHALGYNTIIFIKAMLTCEKKDMERSAEVCKRSVDVIQLFRQKSSLTESLLSFGGRTKPYTDEELHAELCYGQALLFRAMLAFFHDDNFASFIRGALNIRTCYRIYKQCERIMNDETAWLGRDKRVKDQFVSGVCMGLGVFNLMISTLPSRVLRLLEVVGFSGDKETGMNLLHRCASMTDTLHSPLCMVVLLTWHLVAVFMLSSGYPDIPLCHRLLPPLMAKYPKGSVIYFLRARLLLVSSDIDNAIVFFNKSIESQDVYKQFHHGCYWELMFSHSYLRQWSKAANFSKRLVNESRWSRCIYTYTLCIFFSADTTVDKAKREETVAALARKVDGLKMRIAGKSIPMEKFCARKANRFIITKSLFLAHYEFMYIWNGFDIVGPNAKLMQPIHDDIDKCWLNKAEEGADSNDRALYLFLKGICLRHLKCPQKAEQCLSEVVKLGEGGHLTDFYYLLPNALYEIAIIRINEGNRMEAEAYLNEARKVKGYSLENKLHFRIHSAMEMLGTRTPMM